MGKSNRKYNDLYVPDDGRGVGHLQICGPDTQLKRLSSEPIGDTDKAFRDQRGFLKTGAKASLLGCVFLGSTEYLHEGGKHETRYFPHCVLTGEAFLASDEATIAAVHYTFENVDCLVNALGTFGTIKPTREEFVRILAAEEERVDKIAQEHGWNRSRREVQVGDQPILHYFSGRWEILQCDAGIGSVTMANRVSHKLGIRSKGTGIENEITVTLRFVTPRTVDDALSALRNVHGFFELCLGRRQRYGWIEAELVDERAESGDGRIPMLDVYWSLCNERVRGETEPTRYMDVLLSPDARPAEFSKVLTGWLDSAPVVGDARGRFGSAFHSGAYGVDRIVGAANMFDLLPDTYVPGKKELDEPTRALVDETRARFKALPEGFARHSVLSVLGRVGSASLADKICHRADVVIEADADALAELHLPCRQAVLCRNHYVHGSEGAFDYRVKFNEFAFLADTLEFVFAASELIELGWEYDAWRGKRFGPSHKFGRYVADFEENLRNLKRVLS